MEQEVPLAAQHDENVTTYLRGALDSATAVIYTIDRSFRIMTVNASWDEFAVANGAPQLCGPSVVGTNLLDWIREPQREHIAHVCRSIFRGDLPRYEEDFDC